VTGAETGPGAHRVTDPETVIRGGTVDGARTGPDAGAVFRIEWVPGTDRLLGTCHCGAVRQEDDPARLWAWLLAHPAHG
jgi:hypothetical protein